jgi:hypothetical protein
VRAHIVTEAGGNEHIPRIDLGKFHHIPQFREITVAQFQRGKPNPFETSGVRFLIEGQIRAALRDEERDGRLARGTAEESIDPAKRLGAQLDIWHAVYREACGAE